MHTLGVESSGLPDVDESVEGLCWHADPCGDLFFSVALCGDEGAKISRSPPLVLSLSHSGLSCAAVFSFTSLVLVGCILRPKVIASLSSALQSSKRRLVARLSSRSAP